MTRCRALILLAALTPAALASAGASQAAAAHLKLVLRDRHGRVRVTLARRDVD